MANVLLESHQLELTPAISRSTRLKRLTRPLLLVLILLIGAIFRFNDINWDQNRHLHPDERYMTVLATLLKTPSSFAEYLDSGKSPLNPFNTDWGRSYVYGTVPLYAGFYFAHFLEQGCGPQPKLVPQLLGQMLFGSAVSNCPAGTLVGYDYMALEGRILSGLYDLLSILVLFLIGKRLFGWRVGLLAAAFSTATVLQIQQAHFFTVESATNLFVVLTIWFCVLLITDRGPWSFWRTVRLLLYATGAGISTGLALASKVSVWPLIPLIIVTTLVLLIRDQRSGFAPIVSALGALVLAGIFTFGTFRIAQPNAFVGSSSTEFTLTMQSCAQLDARDPLTRVCAIGARLPQTIREIVAPSSRYIQQLILAEGFVNGTIDAPFGIQWTNRTPIVFPLVNIVFWGLGLPLGLAACLGFLYTLRRLLLGRRWWAYLLPVLWTGFDFLYQSTQWTKSMRYLLYIYPTLSLCAAIGLVALWRTWRPDRLSKKLTLWKYAVVRNMPAVLIGMTVSLNLVWALAFSAIYSQPITRVTASEWVFAHVPTALGLSWGKTNQTQLGVKQIILQPGVVQTYPFKLDAGTSPIQSNLQVTLNKIQGLGLVQARVIDTNGQTVLGSGKTSIDASHTVIQIDLGQTVLHAETQYFVELSLLSGQTVSSHTSTVANEAWDDAVPQPIDGKDAYGAYYNGLTSSSDGQMQNYNEDDPSKLPQMLNWLDEADYLVLSSNRLYASIPRLPWRYPMTTEYYRALFAGELGFKLVADFNSFPRLGPFIFNDQEMPQTLKRYPDTQGTPPGIQVPYPTAEEVFSVYDHPRVLIFKKTPAYSRALAQEILGKFDLTRTIKQTPLAAVNSPNGMLFDNKTLDVQQAGGTWIDLFPRTSPLNQSQPLAVLAWLALIEILGLATFPIIVVATSHAVRPVNRSNTNAAVPDGPPSVWHYALVESGYSFTKILALLLVACIAWWLGSTKITTFSALQIWCINLGLIAFGAVLWWRNRDRIRQLWLQRSKVIIASELVFLFGFALFLVVRIGNPDLWHPYMGGEKPMDFAFLNGVLKSTYFPPLDPWFAGGYINYYYFGYVIVGTPIKALGIDPSIAYNLAIPLFYGLTASGAFGLGATFYTTLRRARGSRQQGGAASTPPTPQSAADPLPYGRVVLAGLMAALFVVGLGNLREMDVIWPAWQQLGGIQHGTAPLPAAFSGFVKWVQGTALPIYPNWPYWNPTRPTAGLAVDSVQIAEFPLFTFLYADLHAHMLAMPIAFLALAFALAYAIGVRRWYTIGLGALVVGSLWPTNSWDYPVYLLVALGALYIGKVSERGPSVRLTDCIKDGVRILPALIVFVALTRAFFIPYLENYGSAYNSIEPWTSDRTPLNIYLSIYGLFLAPVIAYLALGIWRNRSGSSSRFIIGVIYGIATLFATLVLLAMRVQVAIVALPLAALAFLAALMPGTHAQTRILWLLTSGAFLLTIFVELFTLKGDVGRMNTVFKFYIQAWLLLGVTSGVMVIWVFERFGEAREAISSHMMTGRSSWWVYRVGRPVYIAAMAILIFLAAMYPVFAVPAKMHDRYATDAPTGLDGMAYMTRAIRYEQHGNKSSTFPLMDDYLAIKWMQDHVQGSPTIMEGTTGPDLYRWGNRFSIYTGLPAVVGWEWHERQQRAALDDRIVYERDSDVSEFYDTTDISIALTLLRRYNARYVIAGQLEHVYYEDQGFIKFAQMVKDGYLSVAYQNPGTTVYKVADVVFPAPLAVSSATTQHIAQR